MDAPQITDYFAAWRAASLGAREVLEGIVAPGVDPASPEFQRALVAWDASEAGGTHYWDALGDRQWLILVREKARPRERWWLHAVLLAVTLVTTTVAGATLGGLSLEWSRFSGAALRAGLAFSVPLAAIMLAHESGHWVAARRLRVDASPPYWIPFPWQLNLIGTMGAFIKLRSPIYDRRTLFDIGVAGPLAGMAVALPALLIGVALSTVAPVASTDFGHQIIVADGTVFYLGDSLLMAAARWIFGVSGTLQLHPTAVAGWVGLLVTSFNLLPLAQFDGGHILHAMDAHIQRRAAIVIWTALLFMGMLWPGWWLWAAVALIIGRGRLTHPEVIAPERPLDRRRMWVGILAVILFVLTFSPLPIAG